MKYPIQANIIGFQGTAATLFSAFDDETGILSIFEEGEEYLRKRRANCYVVTNDTTAEERDLLFKTDHFKSAVIHYYELQRGLAQDRISPTLRYGDKAQRASPSSSIESDGFDESGPRYRFAEAISNTHIATLATCFAVPRLRANKTMLDMSDRLSKPSGLAAGDLLSFGVEERPVYLYGHQVHPSTVL